MDGLASVILRVAGSSSSTPSRASSKWRRQRISETPSAARAASSKTYADERAPRMPRAGERGLQILGRPVP